jgi:hypothetical protein
MSLAALARIILLAFSWPALSAQTASKPAATDPPRLPPSFRILFERGEPIQGVSSSPGVALPFQCTADGTLFVRFVSPAPAGATRVPPPAFQLVSISPSRVSHNFLLEQVPDLQIFSEIDHCAYDSGVVFLVKAMRKDAAQESNQTLAQKAAARHLYLILFDSQGNYKKAIEVEGGMRIQHLAVFPSGTFLVFFYEPDGHAPGLAMLKEDGTYLKTLDIPARTMPGSAIGTEGSARGVLMRVEFVRVGASIVVFQPESKFPILEVSPGGAVRAIPSRLPAGVHIVDLVASDWNLFALAERDKDSARGMIYEVQLEDGAVQRVFTMDDGRDAASVACIHEGKFLSLDYSDGKITPVIGRAEPSP